MSLMVLRRRLKFGLLAFLMLIVYVGLLATAGCNSVEENEQTSIDAIWAETVPEAGAETVYGIPLSLDNTQRFVDWYYDIELSSEEKDIKNTALNSLKAPCCDDYSLRTC